MEIRTQITITIGLVAGTCGHNDETRVPLFSADLNLGTQNAVRRHAEFVRPNHQTGMVMHLEARKQRLAHAVVNCQHTIHALPTALVILIVH